MNEEYVDALDHIMRVASATRQQTRRSRWIAHRAKCALEGGDWREMDLPKMAKETSREKFLQRSNIALTAKLEAATKALERLRVAVMEMNHDYQKGDFDLPELASIDLAACVAAALNMLIDKGLIAKAMNTTTGDEE